MTCEARLATKAMVRKRIVLWNMRTIVFVYTLGICVNPVILCIAFYMLLRESSSASLGVLVRSQRESLHVKLLWLRVS